MQFQGQGKQPVGVVYDSDMGNTIDAVLALAMLYGFQSKGDARVISLSVTKPNLKAAAYCDAVARFYAGGPAGPGGGGIGRNPTVIGLALKGASPEDTPMLTEPLAKKTPEGQPLYSRGVEKMNDTADPIALIRNSLTAQTDQNAVVVLAGPATNLIKVLDLTGAKDVIVKKVKYLVIAAGVYPTGGPEPHIQRDIPAATRLFAEWPTPIVAASKETGDALLFPGASIDKDFAWAPAHPVADAYRAYKPMPYDAPSWAMAAALYAVHPDDGYFKLSEPGTIAVLPDGRTKFTASADGKQRYFTADPAQQEKVIQIYTEMASAKPAPRRPFQPKKKQ